jgi:hypothetical protein
LRQIRLVSVVVVFAAAIATASVPHRDQTFSAIAREIRNDENIDIVLCRDERIRDPYYLIRIVNAGQLQMQSKHNICDAECESNADQEYSKV